ncbi:SIMPL domain-containing protein [Sulfurivirga sp.]|uniref:SIMPL domain-containing protein n=1 Tax=Sulfurivirga sp. TaxID=2614236 RepID=UPI0025CD8249|nr:SIMPL domain-containing protein [Sulfurivirga sp.]
MKKVLAGGLLSLAALLPVWADDACEEGTRVNFSQRVETVVAQDELVATLTATREADTIVALNRTLNTLSQQVDAAAKKLPKRVRLVLSGWNSWPVYDSKRKVIVRWRGQLSYRLTGPLKDDDASRALQALQRYMAVSSVRFGISRERQTALRNTLESRLIHDARARLRKLREAFGAGSATFLKVDLGMQGGIQPKPAPMRAMFKMMAADMPAPKLRGGEQSVAVSGRFEACLLRR